MFKKSHRKTLEIVKSVLPFLICIITLKDCKIKKKSEKNIKSITHSILFILVKNIETKQIKIF